MIIQPKDTRPSSTSTVIWMLGLLVSFVAISPQMPPKVCATQTAYLVGLTMCIAVGYETIKNWQTIIRPDTVACVALYFLTLLEFLFPQFDINEMTTSAAMYHACWLTLVAFGGIVIGRHLAPNAPRWLTGVVQRPASPRALLAVFFIAFFVGILYMLLAVNFNVVEMVDDMMGARFTQPWGRGRFGDWKALLNQLGDLLNLVPPLGGLILARREKYGIFGCLLVLVGIAFCLFSALCGGTRNVLALYLITFLVAYGLSMPRKRLIEFGALCALALFGFYTASPMMLRIRTVGLKGYVEDSSYPAAAVSNDAPSSFYVDLNLMNVSELTRVFPAAHPFLGFEVPFVAAVAPIPRALWKDKPQGLSVSIEDALNVGSEMTLSTTFIGESYMAGGGIGVALAGLFFGVLTGWWSRFAQLLSSEFGFLIYASGFLAIAISMRSLYTLTTASLPTIGAIFLAMIFAKGTPKSDDKLQLPASSA